MSGEEGEIVLNNNGEDLAEQAGEEGTAGGLVVEYVDVGFVVHSEQNAAVMENRPVRTQGCVNGEHLTPSHLT
jgi:hypothetical protein